jgi:hypothetical protein
MQITPRTSDFLKAEPESSIAAALVLWVLVADMVELDVSYVLL